MRLHLLEIQPEISALSGVQRGAVRLHAQGRVLQGMVEVELPAAVALIEGELIFRVD